MVFDYGKDPKAKQKRVMRDVAPKERYVVLYGRNLVKIQRVYPWVDFFHAKKLREGEGGHIEVSISPDLQSLPIWDRRELEL